MSNISFAKNMGSWSQDQLSVDTKIVTIRTAEQVFTEGLTEQEFKLSLDVDITSLDDLISCIGTLYNLRPQKELYDVKIHLAMAKHILKSVKHENS